MNVKHLLGLTLIAGLSFTACKQKDAETVTEGIEQTAEQAQETVVEISGEVLTNTKTAAKENLNRIGTAIDTKIAELDESIKKAASSEKENLEKLKADLQASKDQIPAMISKIESATADTWADVSKEVGEMHQNVKTALTNTKTTMPSSLK